MIWKCKPEALRGWARETEQLRAIVAKDREVPQTSRINAAHNFANALRRYLWRSDSYGFTFPANRVDDLSEWIYSDPQRCPGLRLHYDLYHQMLANTQDEPKDGDILDHSLAVVFLTWTPSPLTGGSRTTSGQHANGWRALAPLARVTVGSTPACRPSLRSRSSPPASITASRHNEPQRTVLHRDDSKARH